MTRTIREPNPEEAYDESVDALVEAQRVLDSRSVRDTRAIGTRRRDLMAGDPASESGTLVSESELDADLRAKINAGSAGTVPKFPFVEYDITPGAPIPAGDPLNINTGLFTGAGARTTSIASYGTVLLPGSGADFQTDDRIIIYRNGQLYSKGPNAGTPRDVYWVSTSQVAFNVNLQPNDTIYIRTPPAY